ncbi:Oidioi.mRNA.OKI2018_I69.chr2.g6216.t1.cds [Oikopleura dioica]|uniref:Oidioi.mRNA.OKI2018_I69.chr2.g6216.t1.cds n=1 Tax=Oikopleura dioica TaxID=34765 RepID=A0ABN7T2C6_OIKDI|nr:Oidioi.mRNA.OKI2018_I69.chr2.g6216.t1.cds [Oikopleura dioica]
MAEILKARETSPAMSEDDINLWTKKILTSAGFVSISMGRFDEAKTFFGQCGINFEEISRTLMKYGKIPSSHLQIKDAEPIEEKFSKRVASENAVKYFMLNSIDTFTKTSSSLICDVYLEMLINQKDTKVLSRAIDEIFFSGISISWDFLLSLFQDGDQDLVFPLAKILWFSGDHEKSLKRLLQIISEDTKENSLSHEIEDFINFILSQTNDPSVLETFISFLDEIIVVSPELAFRVIKATDVSDQVVMKKITKSRALKIRYLEHLVEQSTTKKFVYEELLKEYYKGTEKDFKKFLHLTENPETWKFVRAKKLMELDFGTSVHGLLAKCSVFGEVGERKLTFQPLINGGYFEELEEFTFRRGPDALTELAEYLLENDFPQTVDFLGKFGKYIDGKAILNLLPADAPISKYSKIMRAISAASSHRSKIIQTQNALLTETLLTVMEDIKDKNIMLERSEENWRNNQCKVSGKRIQDDFYLYPKGYVCLPSAAASPFVCPLSGTLLSSLTAAEKS